MKKMMLTIIALATPLAMACPDLTGTYNCQDSSGETWEVTMTTVLENGIYVYTVDDFKIYADGNPYNFSTEHMRGTYVGTCAGNSIDVASNGEILENGQSVGSYQFVNRSTKTSTGFNEKQEGSGVYKGQSFPIDEQGSCQLN